MNNYNYFGAMLDCSRNAVMNVPTLKKFIDCLAKMGYNALELYTEDTYEVNGEPYFGYFRGRYTGAELKEVDAYAKEKGVELIPCIQTLAHFTNPAKLARFSEIIDVNDILLAGDEKTYEFIDKLFASIAENFSSRKVNIGMDEAHMVGLGKYLDQHGFENRSEILCKHLNRVAEIAKKYGFEAHMWSDMFFRLAFNDYYGEGERHIPKEVRDKVPENVYLTYWDYYHKDKNVYDSMLKSHLEFGKEVWFAGGAWTWDGFAPLNKYTLLTMKPAMESVRENNIKNVLITLWGDNGKECSTFSVLPSLYAVKMYADGIYDEKVIAEGFEKLFGVPYDDFMMLDIPNHTPKNNGEKIENCSKSLLYTDCLMGIYDSALQKVGHIPFGEYAKKLEEAKKRAGDFAYIFDMEAKLCKALEKKAYLGIRIRKAYKENDKKELLLLSKECEEARKEIEIFYQSFCKLWYKENKSIGFEVQDVRIGGLMLRLSHVANILKEYVEGKIDCIAELEEEVLDYYPNDKDYLQDNVYRKIVSTSEI